MHRHLLVHRHHNRQRPRRRRQVQDGRKRQARELAAGNVGGGAGDRGASAAAVVIREAGEDQVGEGADGVEGREEVLGVVEEVGGLGAGVVGGDAGEHEHGHDERGLEDGTTWGAGLAWMSMLEVLLSYGRAWTSCASGKIL